MESRGDGMASLNEISDGYREAAILLRVRLNEIREQMKTSEGLERRRLERRALALKTALQEMRDLRNLTQTYYTKPRNGSYTSSNFRAPEVDGNKR